MILIGAGDTGQIILRQTLQNPNSQINVVGFLDDNPKKKRTRLHNVEILGTVKDLSSIRVSFDEVYICAPSADRNQMQSIVNECKKINIDTFCKNPNKRIPVSGTKIRDALIKGKKIDKRFMRPEIVKSLSNVDIFIKEDK